MIPPSGERPSGGEREARRSARLVAIFLLGCAGFAGPLLRVASRPAPAGAWPHPFVFLFGFWALLILLVGLAMRDRRE